MKFKVFRASNYNDSKDPKCPGAYHESEFNWFVDVDSLEDLVEKLKALDKPAVIYPDHYWEDGENIYPEILIYDDYIE